MKPAQAMGLFLATWRAEWARLSRTQLALLVSSELHKPNAVTVSVVRQWEAGQPPKSLAELEALCRVMGRRALSPPEVVQFRQAVYAACLDRHYEGLFSDRTLSPTAEVEELAPIGDMWNLVELLPRLHVLTQYVTDPPVRPCPRRLLHRWQAARVLLLTRQWYLHFCAKRHLQATSTIHQSGQLLATVFGPGSLYGQLMSPAQMRSVEAHGRAHDLREPGAAERMLALSSEFRAEGNLLHCALSLLDGVWALADADNPRFVYADLRRDVQWALTYVGDRVPEAEVGGVHHAICNALVAEGNLKAAARHLPLVEKFPATYPAVYPWSQGRFAYAAGGYEEAQRHFERAHALSLRKYGDWVTDSALEWLGKCERAQHETRHRGKGRVIGTNLRGARRGQPS
jgi:hypothetical protein